MSDYDTETGEVLSNGAAAARVSADAWRQKRMDDKGMGYRGLYDALRGAYADIPGVILNDSEAGDKFKFRYASLKQVIDTVRNPLLKFGVLIRQGAEHSQKMEGGGFLVPVYTDLVHASSGEVVRTKIDIPIVKFDPQSVGSAITYGKRYTLLAALGIATDDDDNATAAKPNDLGDKKIDDMLAAIKKCKDYDALMKWRGEKDVDRAIKQLVGDDFEKVKAAFMKRKDDLSEAA